LRLKQYFDNFSDLLSDFRRSIDHQFGLSRVSYPVLARKNSSIETGQLGGQASTTYIHTPTHCIARPL